MKRKDLITFGIAILAGALLAIVLVQANKVDGAPAEKVFVCKYVGKPGVDERLQTGQNPISVSSNAIKDYAGVGSSFNDAQGRSLVVAIDTGQDEPECPVPQNPPKEVPISETPKVTPPNNQENGGQTPQATKSGGVEDNAPLVTEGK